MDKRLRDLTKLARSFGRTLEKRKGGHLSFVCKRGERKTVFFSATPSYHRAIKNVTRDLRHADTKTKGKS